MSSNRFASMMQSMGVDMSSDASLEILPTLARASQEMDVPWPCCVNTIMQHEELFDTTPPAAGGCHHGAPEPGSTERSNARMYLTLYFARQLADEETGAPLAFTNMQFYSRFYENIDESMLRQIWADAANNFLKSNYSNARLVVRLAMTFEAFRINDPHGALCTSVVRSITRPERGRGGGRGRRNSSSDPARTLSDAITSAPWLMALRVMTESTETPWEVGRYIASKIPCRCLASKIQEQNTDSLCECHKCHKKLPASALQRCSRCKMAQCKSHGLHQKNYCFCYWVRCLTQNSEATILRQEQTSAF